jgi:drug/metabolite transporter (DMT)-like permease
MDITVAALALTSAFLHPFWNLLVKDNAYPEGVFLALIVFHLLLGGLQAIATGADLLSAIEVWPLLLLAAVGELLFGINLVATYRRGDLSVYYPIVRSSPLFVVIVSATVLGERYSALLLAGIGLVIVAAFFLQYRRGARLLHDPVTVVTAMLAMVGTGVYSLADARALQTIDPAVRFVWVELLVAPCLAVYFAFTKPAGCGWRTHLFAGWRLTPGRFLAAGVLAYGSYLLILMAYQFGGDVAAVTSLRQASIPISVVLGGLYLREASMLARLFWSVVLAVGIVVIILAPQPS